MADQNECHVVSIEELHARKVVKRVGNQASGSNNAPPADVATLETHHGEQKEVSTSSSSSTGSNDWQEKLNKMLTEHDERARVSQTPAAAAAAKPKIQRVPPLLRDQKNFVKYFKPRAIRLGPIHSDNHDKFQVSETFKPKLAAKFIRDSGSTNDGKDLYMTVRNNIRELRDCYEEEVTKHYDDDSLAWMLFLDGCSTLQFIRSYQSRGELKNDFKIKDDQICFAQQDLFLLENQLPYRLLKLLMDKNKDLYRESIVQFVCDRVMAPQKLARKLALHLDAQEPHLLELLQSALLYQPPNKTPNIKKILYQLPGRDENEESCHSRPYTHRNVQELKAVGNKLKRGSNRSLRDISFHFICFEAYLKLPPLIVDNSTGPLFSNLIAYEMLPDNIQSDYGVTSYISFLDKLIDNADDVKDLRAANVLQNRLGSDLEVADLFNQIGTDLVPDPAVYGEVTARIKKYYDNRWTTWFAQAYYENFRDVAFIVAVVALALTAVQTWYSIQSSPCDSLCTNLTKSFKP